MRDLDYLNPNSTQTLREGVRELRAHEGATSDAAENVVPDLSDDIDMHDAIHVLFGCPTNLLGEIIAHVWTAFGTTVKMQDMHRVNMHDDHQQVLSKIGYGRLIKTWLSSLPRIIATLISAMAMKHRWPAEDYTFYLDQRLCDLRENFGIRLPELPLNDQASSGAALRTIQLRNP
ncbi:hypothetical protein C1752_00128 [Acaryochloris thomasi RCC1774]|uniref:Uncharacterized protein n=1 Tax=Acaryochloris thomasi RCC1774 TaxID=1764569 RepID=A0A2W1K746_9CYAN|nr:hypothetical protein [Acaryochloris thomasi]PZD75357.1 hypothetical protein C1752_00128 [Acaryochloris thomasi RCC1774]